MSATRHVALTFDDGPHPTWTPRVLRALAEARATATFFVVGTAAERYPGPIREALAAGHDVQLHCHEHRRHAEMSRAELEADTDVALAVLAELGVHPTRWRTPWGVTAPWSREVAADRGLELTHWSADTEDWAGERWPMLLERVRPGLRSGAVILAHDGLGPGALRGGCAATAALVGPLVAATRRQRLEPGALPPVDTTREPTPC